MMDNPASAGLLSTELLEAVQRGDEMNGTDVKIISGSYCAAQGFEGNTAIMLAVIFTLEEILVVGVIMAAIGMMSYVAHMNEQYDSLRAKPKQQMPTQARFI
jgi:hypothetical protein